MSAKLSQTQQEDTNNVPRPEYPNPQFQRQHWKNLNGTWDFAFDFSVSAKDRKVYENPTKEFFNKRIAVPFCPESPLSGIHFTDFIPCCWYRRTIEIKQEELSGKILLHFGAVDYIATIYVNGIEVGTHRGGYASFSFEISSYLHEGLNELIVCAEDNLRSFKQPAGKQSALYDSFSCFYTRTTGIWQTVWLEFVPKKHILDFACQANVSDYSITITALTSGPGELHAIASYDGQNCGETRVHTDNGVAIATISLAEHHLWSPGHGNLYSLSLDFENDHVDSYFGLRDIRLDGNHFLINGKPIFQRLVLDQGFYPDGIYTAPTANDLEQDVILSMKAGFNGARLHEKAFEPLFLYYCDVHGYLAWGEMANWQLDISSNNSYPAFIPEWIDIVRRDRNHPSIIGWCPFNETWDFQGRKQQDNLLQLTYRITKTLDPSRPCIDTSGMFHVITDIYDVHDYEQDAKSFSAHYRRLTEGQYTDPFPERQHYSGSIPFFVSEYGGIKWSPSQADQNSWGYGQQANSEAEFIKRYRDLTLSLLNNPAISGFCYTQLYDVEQEQNGLYDYWRQPKVDINSIRSINTTSAASEINTAQSSINNLTMK